MTNTSKSRKRCPACGSSNPADAWECEMCGASFSDVKPPKSIQQANAQPKASAPAAKPAPAKTASQNSATTPAAKPATKQAKPATTASAAKTTAKPAAANTAKVATETINTPIKNAGSMKKPAPLYASKPRFGLGSLVALVFVAAFAIAAIVFGLNALNNTTPASPAQPVFTLDATATVHVLPTETSVPPTEAPIEAAPAMAATEAPTLVPVIAPTEAPVATTPVEQTVAPSPTPAVQPTTPAQPTATPRATATAAPTAAPAATATSAPVSAGGTLTYTVKGGDTCGKIAKQFGITVAEIIQWNNLDDRCFLNVNKVLTVQR